MFCKKHQSKTWANICVSRFNKKDTFFTNIIFPEKATAYFDESVLEVAETSTAVGMQKSCEGALDNGTTVFDVFWMILQVSQSCHNIQATY